MMPEAPALESRPRLVSFGPFAFDAQNRLLSRNGTEIPLPPRVLGVLELLISRPGEVVPRQELLDSVWKDAFVTDTSLAEAVSFLRQALGDDPQSPQYVQTVHRRGYRFLPPVAPAVQPNAPAPAAPPQPIKPSIARDLAPWSIAAICAVLAITALWQALDRPQQDPPPVVRFTIQPLAGTSFDRRAPALAISPDGQTVAWSACEIRTGICGLFVRQLDRLDAAALRGTTGAVSPFFAPDGRWIGFFADGKLKKIATAGGSATTIADAPVPAGGSWNADGRIVFGGSAAGGLSVVSDQGGEVRTLTTPRVDRGEVRHGWPSWLPDGAGILFTIAGSTLPGASSQLAALPLPSSSGRLLRAGVTRGLVTGHGYLLLATGADLQAQTFDQRTLGLLGAADGVLDGLDTADGLAQFTVNDAGTLMAVKAPAEGRAVTWSDETSRNLGLVSRLRDVSISPDGRRAAGVSVDAAGSDIFVVDLDRGSATRMTYRGTHAMPVWTPDGRLLFASRSTGPFSIVTTAPQGGGTQTVLSSGGHLFPGSAASDGRLAVTGTQPDGRLAIGIAAHAGGEIGFFNDGPFDESTPAFSPEGMWLAFASNESGRWEIYVRNLRDGRRVAVSTEGGERPSWTADGRWIYFHDATRVLRAAFNGTADPRAGAPEVVFNRPDGRVIAVAPSGRLLLEQQPAASQNAVIVLQWLREIRQRLPTPIPASR